MPPMPNSSAFAGNSSSCFTSRAGSSASSVSRRLVWIRRTGSSIHQRFCCACAEAAAASEMTNHKWSIFIRNSPSEVQLQTELKLPTGRRRARQFPETLVPNGQCRATGRGQEESGCVAHVEGFRPELRPYPLPYLEILEQRNIEVDRSRPPADAARGVTKQWNRGAICTPRHDGLRECRWIEVTIYRLVGEIQRLPEHNVRNIGGCEQIGRHACAADIG